MRSLCTKKSLLSALFCMPLALWAQPICQAALDSAQVELGNAFYLHLQVPDDGAMPGDPQVDAQQDTFAAQNMLDLGTWKNIPGKGWQRQLTLIALDTGMLLLPSFRIPLAGGGVCETPALSCRVYALEKATDPSELAGIKDIHRTPASWQAVLEQVGPWLAGLLLVLLALVLWRLLVKPKKPLPDAAALPPDQWALSQLDALAKAQPWLRGDVEGYYTKVSWIVREYVQRQTGAPALEKPVVEWLTLLPESVRPVLRDLLERCDLAKFARHQPPAEAHPNALHEARAIIAALQPAKTEGT